MAGLGPAPFAALMLAEMGARVVRIERAGKTPLLPMPPQFDLDRHGREILTARPQAGGWRGLVLRLPNAPTCSSKDFGRMSWSGWGWGRTSAGCQSATGLCPHDRLWPGRAIAGVAGHDLTYLAWSGVLHAIGEKGCKPVPPLNLMADYGGGAMFLIAGVLAALFERQRSGKGQVVDAAMIEGASMLAAPTYALMAAGLWQDRRGDNLLDGGAPFYDTYETADGRHVAIACLEPQFFAEFARLLPLDAGFAARQYDRGSWNAMRSADRRGRRNGRAMNGQRCSGQRCLRGAGAVADRGAGAR